jgi:hypothetical protein
VININKINQVILISFLSFLTATIWSFLTFFSGLILFISDSIGLFDYVGKPGSIDGGAILSSGLFLLLYLFFIGLLIRKTRMKSISISLIIVGCGLLSSVIVFCIYSSLIWL